MPVSKKATVPTFSEATAPAAKKAKTASAAASEPASKHVGAPTAKKAKASPDVESKKTGVCTSEVLLRCGLLFKCSLWAVLTVSLHEMVLSCFLQAPDKGDIPKPPPKKPEVSFGALLLVKHFFMSIPKQAKALCYMHLLSIFSLLSRALQKLTARQSLLQRSLHQRSPLRTSMPWYVWKKGPG